MKFLRNPVIIAVLAAVSAFFAPVTAMANPPRVSVFSKTYDPASVATTAQTSTTVSAPGAALGDTCSPSFSLDQALVEFTCYISAAGTATVLVKNGTAGTVDLASGTLRVFVFPKNTR